MRALFSVLSVGLVGVIAGCAVETGESVSEGESELSTSTASFVTLSQPICKKAPCPAYVVQDVNKSAAQAVGNLDFSRTSFTKSDIAAITSAPASEIVLKGKLGGVQAKTHLRSFIVTEAYRGLPGVTYASDAQFLQGSDFSPPIQCFAAPCEEGTTKKLNTTLTMSYDAIDVSAAAKPFVSTDLLHAQVASANAIVAGSIVAGEKLGTRAKQVLTAQQIFFKLPPSVGECPVFKLAACADGQIRTYTRDANLCVLPSECVTPGMCAMFLPACEEGYTLSSWKAAPHACSAYACDPSFLVTH
jgi:hypothetical protein